jgi:hypothetical protein
MYALQHCSVLNSNSFTPLHYLLVALQRIIGVQVAWMRPPYGSFNDQVTAVANARGQNCTSFLLVLTLLFIDETTSSKWLCGTSILETLLVPLQQSRKKCTKTPPTATRVLSWLSTTKPRKARCTLLISDVYPGPALTVSLFCLIDLMCSLLLSKFCKQQVTDSSL